MLAPEAVPALREIRDPNAILFDFVLKRPLRSPAAGGHRFPASTFQARRRLVPAAA